MSAIVACMTMLLGIELAPMLAEANGFNGGYVVYATMMITVACLITLPIISLLTVIL